MPGDVYIPILGRTWSLRNESSYPTYALAGMLTFAIDATGGLSAKGAVRVIDAGARTRGHYSGTACDRRRHHFPKWAGRARFAMRLTMPGADYDSYGKPRVCWHSTQAREMYRAEKSVDAVYRHIERLHGEGATKWGRWPIYIIHDWRELFVHLAAHEAAHLLQYDRERGAGGSEIFCEEFAARVLDAWRKTTNEEDAA